MEIEKPIIEILDMSEDKSYAKTSIKHKVT